MMITKYKMIDRKGRITIPAEIRRDFGFSAGDAIGIDVTDGKLIIARHSPSCMFCGSIEKLGKHKGRNVCMDCVSKMVEEVCKNG